MQFNQIIRVLAGSMVLLMGAFGTFNAYANNYNAGFVAAESGDYAAAVAYWKPLAEQGHALAQFNLALLYHSGEGVAVDEQKAVTLYHMSADNGYFMAQAFLAVGYSEGWFGLERNTQKAQYWQQQLDSE